ncbi:MAG: hypothetical protein RMJ65_03670 [candidate division WOR-3 bacterium]|nr:hypothetical protein [candidate division WOR-3 bacterium]
MKQKSLKKLLLGLIIIIVGFIVIVPEVEARSLTRPPRDSRIRDKKYLDINRWRCPFYNEGRYAYDEATGEGGGFWPYPLRNQYIFGAGPWVGAIKGSDTLVTNGYNPNTAYSEFFPAPSFEQSTGNAYDRIYKYPSDWPPPQWRFGYDTSLVPQKAFSLQDMWCVYSDHMEDFHVAPGRPLGIEVYQTILAWNYPTNQDIFFILYKVKNVSPDTLKQVILGACMDPDIGESGYHVLEEGDMVGLIKKRFIGGDTVRDVGFVGDYNNLETSYWQSGTPGAVAYKFLEGAHDPETGQLLGMTAFKKFTIDIDPPKDVDQYLTLAGYDYRTGIYSPYDSIDLQPMDKRFIACTGPFNLPPGGVANILVACLAAPYGDAGELWPNRDTNDLKPLCKLAVTAEFIYNQGWLLPGPPAAPNAVLYPMDKAIRIVWDDIAERTPDPYYDAVASDTTSPGYDPNYRRFDFEGYKLYKSADGINWTLLTQCDLDNGIKFKIRNDTLFYGDTTSGTGVTTLANDRGVFYSYVDKNVVNGFVYYYKVATYDLNFTTAGTQIDTISFESNPPPISARPRWEAPNYSSSWVKIDRVIGGTNNALRCSTKIVLPYLVPKETLKIKFAGPVYTGSSTRVLYRYVVEDKNGNIVQDTVRFYYTIGATKTQNLPPVGGTELIAKTTLTLPTRVYDTIYPITGNYPADRLAPRNVTIPIGQWAYRGSDYKIVWQVVGGIKTCKVLDVTNGNIEVPKTKFQTTPIWYDSMANGWCFVDRTLRNGTDTLKTGSAYLYLNWGYIALNRVSATVFDTVGALINNINDGDTWYIKANPQCISAPYYNVFYLYGQPAEIRSDTTYTLNVKVVPNPYLITNRWETGRFDRRIAFTHLPARCKIRIYTVAGNLVRIIEHNDTSERPMDKGGTEYWDLLNEHNQLVSSGIYIFHIESDVGEQIGKFAIVQ